MRQTWFFPFAAVGAFALAGCGGSAEVAEKSPSSTAPAADAIKRRDPSSLPAVGDYLPPLDDGRVEIAPPEGWKTLPRHADFLVVFNKGESANDFPRISITASDTSSGIADVTEDSAGAFAEAMAKQLRSEKKSFIAEPPKPIILGDQTWSRYVRNPIYNGEPIAIQMLQTVRGGRQYNVELIVNVKVQDQYAEDLKAGRDAAYAVAANMKFLKGDDAGEK